MALLERHRQGQGQPEVVQEGMYRDVSSQAQRSIAASAERAQVQVTPLVGQLVGSIGRCSDAHSERMSASLAIWRRSTGLRGSIMCY
ncbi:hypothetical protein GGR62_001172 [Xanthomonas campestris]|nr:hypothetical protein [Xanthomonas sp. 3075]